MPDEPLVTTAVEAPDDVLDEGPVLPRRVVRETADLDITPMIDVVFLLLIFFLVSSTPDQNTSVELPPARHGQGVSQQNSVIITVAKREGDRPAAVYLADGAKGTPLPDDPKEKETAIVAAVEQGFLQEMKTSVLIKGGRDVKQRDIYAVEKAVGRAQVEDVKLHVAVFERD